VDIPFIVIDSVNVSRAVDFHFDANNPPYDSLKTAGVDAALLRN
jgi:hypothetical protein